MAKKITFELPRGVTVPDGKQPGDTFQAMATFLLDSGGKVELTEVDGEALDGATKPSDAPDASAQDDSSQPMAMSLQDRLMGGAGGQ